jgi:hypothetical protein
MTISMYLRRGIQATSAIGILFGVVSGTMADSYSFGATQGVSASNPGHEQIYSNNMGGGLLGATATGNTVDDKSLKSDIKSGSGQATSRSSKTDADKSKWELSEMDASKSFSAGQDARMDSALKDDSTKPNPRGHNQHRRQNP